VKKMIRRLRAAWLAFRDPEVIEIKDELTGALTRKTFLQVANRELARTQRGGQPLSLIFIDLDDLKLINDKQGHKAGDFFLRAFAQTILICIRPYDLLVRWGGDEFILLFPNTTSLVAKKVIGRVCEKFSNFSWGISEWEKNDTLESLVTRADDIMYQHKQAKKVGKPGL
jgi:diguanylate cyclase (GGDEF)-like protein